LEGLLFFFLWVNWESIVRFSAKKWRELTSDYKGLLWLLCWNWEWNGMSRAKAGAWGTRGGVGAWKVL
jgi:hypothetical protein